MPLRHTLLGLLNTQPMHGYVLRQRARDYAWIYPMTNASIYPALHGLEEDGFITHESEIHNGRARKIYNITESGRRELHHWLLSPVQQTPSLRDQMLLKIVMQGDETIGGARQWLETALDDLRNEISVYSSEMGTEGPVSVSAELVRDFGLELLHMRARLVERVLEVAKEPLQSRLSKYENGRSMASAR